MCAEQTSQLDCRSVSAPVVHKNSPLFCVSYTASIKCSYWLTFMVPWSELASVRPSIVRHMYMYSTQVPPQTQESYHDAVGFLTSNQQVGPQKHATPCWCLQRSQQISFCTHKALLDIGQLGFQWPKPGQHVHTTHCAQIQPVRSCKCFQKICCSQWVYLCVCLWCICEFFQHVCFTLRVLVPLVSCKGPCKEVILNGRVVFYACSTGQCVCATIRGASEKGKIPGMEN